MSVTADIDVDHELDDIAGHLNVQHGRLVEVTARLLTDVSLWQGPGVWRIEQFLAWRTGVSPARARQIATIARRADEFPTCVAAMQSGELSLDQVAAIAGRAPGWTDTQICGLAKNLTVSQLRRVVTQYRFPTIDADPADPEHDVDTAEEQATVNRTACEVTENADPSPARCLLVSCR